VSARDDAFSGSLLSDESRYQRAGPGSIKSLALLSLVSTGEKLFSSIQAGASMKNKVSGKAVASFYPYRSPNNPA
jgi:hypothetical protein